MYGGKTLPQVQVKVSSAHLEQDDSTKTKRLLEEARSRAEEECNLSISTKNAHYAAASLGQLPYVSVPGVGVVLLRKGGWSC